MRPYYFNRVYQKICILWLHFTKFTIRAKKRRGRRKTASQFDEKEEHFISDDELQIEEYNLITTVAELTIILKPKAVIKPKASIKPKEVSKIEINVTNVDFYVFFC